MSNDIEWEKLTPAPWKVISAPEHLISGRTIVGPNGEDIVVNDNDGCASDPCPDYVVIGEADATFMVLARNTFDVMTRRGWSVFKEIEGWSITNSKGFVRGTKRKDPFTAVVETEEWYIKNVESK